MEGDAVSEVKNVSQRVGRLPRFGEVAVQRHFVVALDEAVEKQTIEVLRLRIGRKTRIEVRRIRFDQ